MYSYKIKSIKDDPNLEKTIAMKVVVFFSLSPLKRVWIKIIGFWIEHIHTAFFWNIIIQWTSHDDLTEKPKTANEMMTMIFFLLNGKN